MLVYCDLWYSTGEKYNSQESFGELLKQKNEVTENCLSKWFFFFLQILNFKSGRHFFIQRPTKENVEPPGSSSKKTYSASYVASNVPCLSAFKRDRHVRQRNYRSRSDQNHWILSKQAFLLKRRQTHKCGNDEVNHVPGDLSAEFPFFVKFGAKERDSKTRKLKSFFTNLSRIWFEAGSK